MPVCNYNWEFSLGVTLPYSIFSIVSPELAELPNCLFVCSLSVMLAGGGFGEGGADCRA